MEIFCILIFGFAFIRTLTPLMLKKSYNTFPVFFGIFVNAAMYGICYIWFLSNLLNK